MSFQDWRGDKKRDKGKYIWDGPCEIIWTLNNKELYELKTSNGDKMREKHHGSRKDQNSM